MSELEMEYAVGGGVCLVVFITGLTIREGIRDGILLEVALSAIAIGVTPIVVGKVAFALWGLVE